MKHLVTLDELELQPIFKLADKIKLDPTHYQDALKNKIITPPARFDKVPENAIPIASPTAPNKATKDVISIPSWLRAVMITSILKVIVMALSKKDSKEGS